MKYKAILTIGIILIIYATTSYAQFLDDVSIHGFGGWAYGKTDNENRYLMGNEDGNYDFVNFSLNISAGLYKNLRIYVQPSYNEIFNQKKAGLDYAFAEWYFSEFFAVRIGKVKMPFMGYNEIYDVGTLRPFFMLPQGVYLDFSSEAYKGAGITGTLYSGDKGEVRYDIFGGAGELLPQREVITLAYKNPEGDLEYLYTFADMIYFGEDLLGGRLSCALPVDGLNLTCSYYSVKVGVKIEELNWSEKMGERFHFGGVSLEYIADPIWFIAEYAGESFKYHDEKDQLKRDYEDTGYIEAAYKFTDHWQAAARYEYEGNKSDEQDVYDSLNRHKEFGVGVNYWFSRNFVLKVSVHTVTGNSFADPDKLDDYLRNYENQSFKEKTTLLLMGAQFSF